MDKEDRIDDEDESPESSSEHRDVSPELTPFGAAQREYENVVIELQKTDGLEKYASAFTNIFELLSKTHTSEQTLAEKCAKLESNLEETIIKLSATVASSEEDKETIRKLKQELEKSWKLTDAAHAREQNAQEAIENLRLQVSRLKTELEKKTEMGGDQADETGPAAKTAEGLKKERERLLNELSVLKERMTNAQTYQEELEKEISVADSRINELTQELEARASEASKEQRIRDRMEQDLKELKTDLESKEREVMYLSLNLKEVQTHEEKLQMSLSDEKLKVDNLTKQVEGLNSQLQKTMLDYEHQQILFEKLTNENAQKTTDLKQKEDELIKMRNELLRANKLQESYLKKVQQMDQLRGAAEERRVKATQTLELLERDMDSAKKQALQDKRSIENLTRQKEILNNNLLKMTNMATEQSKMFQITEKAKRGLELKLGQAAIEAAKQKKLMAALEHERDRQLAEGIELTRKMEETLQEVSFKQMAIIDLKKQLADADIKFTKQQDMIEALRSDRNSLSKNLQQAKDEISELKQKLEVMTRQVEQLKEYVTSAENQLIKEQSALQKVEKEREQLRAELQQTREALSQCRQEVAALHQEVRRLQQTIREGELERRRLQKDMDKVLTERDILGTQLVRRNDERSLLYEKIKLLEGTLNKGDADYEQRLEDIKVLKLEVKTLRQEKTLLSKNVSNMNDLRQEILHLQRDLTQEKCKCRALEEELQNPLNVHRWRKLEGSDPERYELVLKVQHLQRRIMEMAKAATTRETLLQDAERRSTELAEKMEKQAGLKLTDKINEMRHVMTKKTRSVRCIEAELIVFKAEAQEYKHKLELLNEELIEFKKMYFELKRKEQKRKEQLAEGAKAMNINSHPQAKPRFTGGGFNLEAHPAKRAASAQTT